MQSCICMVNNGALGTYNRPDGPSRMAKRPTESGGEPSSSNCSASAGVKARHLSKNRTTPCPARFPLAMLAFSK